MENEKNNMTPPEPPKDENGEPLPPPENGEAAEQPAIDESDNTTA